MGHDLTRGQLRRIADCTLRDINALPLSSVPFVAGVVALQTKMPRSMQTWLIDKLGKRADLSVVSPAVEAVMWLYEMASRRELDPLQQKYQTHILVLKSLEQMHQIDVIASFIDRLANAIASEVSAEESGVSIGNLE